ncbi:MAG: phage tail protein [Crinalium sp.]
MSKSVNVQLRSDRNHKQHKMPYSLSLYKNLPSNVRLFDQLGLLEHICNIIQVDLDRFYTLIGSQSRLYDPDLTDEIFLDWLQQLVGLAPEQSRWLGIGLNPDWSDNHKRVVISRVWIYWQIKGTERAIREAIALWLQWEDAKTAKLEIVLPFGTTATSEPPKWCVWGQSYDEYLLQTYKERRQLGSGDYSNNYTPNYFVLKSNSSLEWNSNINWIIQRAVLCEAPTNILSEGSKLGPRRPWMHFYLNLEDWNKIFPDIFQLNPEIWHTLNEVTVLGWLGEHEIYGTTTDPLSIDPNNLGITEYLISRMHWSKVVYPTTVVGSTWRTGEVEGYESYQSLVPQPPPGGLPLSDMTIDLDAYQSIAVDDFIQPVVLPPIAEPEFFSAYTELREYFFTNFAAQTVQNFGHQPQINIDNLMPMGFYPSQDTPCIVFSGLSGNAIFDIYDIYPYSQIDYTDNINTHPLVLFASQASNWRIVLKTPDGFYLLFPVTSWFYQEATVEGFESRQQFFDLGSGHTQLYLEFVFQPQEDLLISSVSLFLGSKLINDKVPSDSLVLQAEGCYGFVYTIPLQG